MLTHVTPGATQQKLNEHVPSQQMNEQMMGEVPEGERWRRVQTHRSPCLWNSQAVCPAGHLPRPGPEAPRFHLQAQEAPAPPVWLKVQIPPRCLPTMTFAALPPPLVSSGTPPKVPSPGFAAASPVHSPQTLLRLHLLPLCTHSLCAAPLGRSESCGPPLEDLPSSCLDLV